MPLDKPKSKTIDSTYEYIYEPIKKGLSLNTRLAASYSYMIMEIIKNILVSVLAQS